MNIAEQMLDWKVDGIITDCTCLVRHLRSYVRSDYACLSDPNVVRRVTKQYGLPSAPTYPKHRVLSCLKEHLARQHV